MPACEKCWGDAYMRMFNNPIKSQTEHYQDLLEERKGNPCTSNEQKYGRKVKDGKEKTEDTKN